MLIRWFGKTSGAWNTVGVDDANANWRKADGLTVADAIPRVAGSAINLTGQARVDANNFTVTFATANATAGTPATWQVGDAAKVSNLLTNSLLPTGLNWTATFPAVFWVTSVAVDGGNTTLTLHNPAGMAQGQATPLYVAYLNSGSLAVAGNVAARAALANASTIGVLPTTTATVTFMGDDVQMLTADSPTNLCTTGPTGATTINSLTITTATAATAPNYFGTCAGQLSLSGFLSYIDVAGTKAAGALFGNGSLKPNLLGGAGGLVILQPPSSSLGDFVCDTAANGELTVAALAYADPAHTGYVRVTSQVYGTLTSPATLTGYTLGDGLLFYSRTRASTGTINLNHTTVGSHNVASIGGGVINIGAAIALSGSDSSYGVFAGSPTITVNTGGSLAIFGTTSQTMFTGDTSLITYGPVALVNFTITTGKTLTVTTYGQPVEIIDVPTGVIVVGSQGGGRRKV